MVLKTLPGYKMITSNTSPHMWLGDGDFQMCYIVMMWRQIAQMI